MYEQCIHMNMCVYATINKVYICIYIYIYLMYIHTHIHVHIYIYMFYFIGKRGLRFRGWQLKWSAG